MLLGACSWIPKGEAQFDVGIKDRGVASWYGEQFHGRQAANGEIFDMEALTAAHRTMPLGSIVRVVNFCALDTLQTASRLSTMEHLLGQYMKLRSSRGAGGDR